MKGKKIIGGAGWMALSLLLCACGGIAQNLPANLYDSIMESSAEDASITVPEMDTASDLSGEEQNMSKETLEEIRKLYVAWDYYDLQLDIFLHNRFIREHTYYEPKTDDENLYAVMDINWDGVEELLVNIRDYGSGSAPLLIYRFDQTTMEMKEQLCTSDHIRNLYGNGVMEVNTGQNRGLAGDFWPYIVYQYNGVTGIYSEAGFVDAWDGNIHPTDSDGNPFPEQLDQDGDKMLFFLDHDYDHPVDNAQYEQWSDAFVGDADAMEIDWYVLDEEQLEWDTSEFMDWMGETYLSHGDPDDMGIRIIQNRNSQTDEVRQYLADTWQVDFQTDDATGNLVGYLNGEIVVSTNSNLKCDLFYSKQIGNATVFGTYPGMDVTEAKQKITEAGFFDSNVEPLEGSLFYQNGFFIGAYLVELQYEGDKVTQIIVRLIRSV